MADKKQKVLRTRKIRTINVGVFIIGLVLVYIIVNIVISIRKDHVSLYEVQAINMAQDNTCEAVIIRNEENYYTDKAGYTNYYIRSGSRVAVGDAVYSIDESKNIYDYLTDYDLNYDYSESDIEMLRKCVSDYYSENTLDDYSGVYNLRTSLETEIAGISDSFLLENLDQIQSSTDTTFTFDIKKAEKAGVVSFFSDSLEGLTADSVTAATFDRKNYSAENIFDSDIKQSGSFVYKIVDDSSWAMVFHLTPEQYDNLSEKSSITFTIKNDGLKLTKECSFYKQGDDCFCRIVMDNYMIRYIKDRFLEIRLELADEEGLKIPYSSLVDKEFFVVPINYYVSNPGEDPDHPDYGFNFMNYDETTRSLSYGFKPCEIYYKDEENGVVYVDTKDLDYGQYIYSMDDETRYQVSVIKKIKGVYNVNRGYAIFRRIEIISEDEDYCIVREGANLSIGKYDHILLNASLLKENNEVY